ncbi:MAG: HmuY family protein [Euryarchaeota archaeon]
MNLKRSLTLATCIVVAIAAGWTYLVVNYESELGTKNIIIVSDAGPNASGSSDDSLVVLAFEDGAEPLAWSSIQLSIVVEEQTHTCSFGSQSTDGASASKVDATLGADGVTFTTVIDASDESTPTFLDLPAQRATDENNSTLSFSKTDVFLSDGVQWAYLDGATFQDVTQYNVSDLSNQTEERLEWYSYDFTEHRVQPTEGVYILEHDGLMFKMQFITYYNQADESRYPTITVAALNGTAFPALNDVNLVEPSPCLIIVSDGNTSVWSSNTTITLIENGVQICNGPCSFEVQASYETASIKVKGTRSIE